MVPEMTLGGEVFSLLFEIDAGIAAAVKEGACAWCGGALHRGNFERKPRGGALAEAGERYLERGVEPCAPSHRPMASLEQLASKAMAKPAAVTFAEFAERWMRNYVGAENQKWSGRRSKRMILDRHLLPAFGHLSLPEITTDKVARFKAELAVRPARRRAGNLTPKTINNILTVLRKALDIAVEWGELQAVPRIRSVRLGRTPFRYLTERDLQRLLAACPPGAWKAMITVAAFTRLRFSELAALEWADIDLIRRHVFVWRGKVSGHIDTPKNNSSRRVPLPELAVAELVAHGPSTGPVFAHFSTHKQAAYALRRLSANAGLGILGWHALRHTYATHLVQAGVPLPTVQKLLGHADIRTTMRYVHVGDQDAELRAAVESLDRRNLGHGWAAESPTDLPKVEAPPARLPQQSQTTADQAVV